MVITRPPLIGAGNRVMNTKKELWGPDALEFKPERACLVRRGRCLTRTGWLDIPDDAKEEDKPGKSIYAFQSFIHGQSESVLPETSLTPPQVRITASAPRWRRSR